MDLSPLLLRFAAGLAVLLAVAGPASATVYRMTPQDASIVVTLASPGRLVMDFSAETRCESFTREPASFGLNLVATIMEEGQTFHPFDWSRDGSAFDPGEGRVTLAWSRTDDLLPRFVAQGRAEFLITRTQRTLSPLHETMEWRAAPFVAYGNSCGGLQPKLLEADREDRRPFQLRSPGIVSGPSEGRDLPADAPGVSGLLAGSLGSLGVIAWRMNRSRRTRER